MTKTANATSKKRTSKPQPKQLTVRDLMGVRGGQGEGEEDEDGKTEPKGFSKDGLA